MAEWYMGMINPGYEKGGSTYCNISEKGGSTYILQHADQGKKMGVYIPQYVDQDLKRGVYILQHADQDWKKGGLHIAKW